MRIVTANCPACGAPYNGSFTSRFITCEYCDTRFALSKEELDALGFEDRDGDGIDDNDTPQRTLNQDSTTPMAEYAREACDRFLKEADEDSFASSRKIIKGLGLGDDEVFLIHDDTMFKSGKNGFAITREGLYCREFGDRDAHFMSWNEFAKGRKPRLDDSYIRQDKKSVCYFTDDSEVLEGELLDLYVELYEHACAVL